MTTDKILNFVRDTGIVKYAFLLLVITGLGESLTPAIEVISSKLSKKWEREADLKEKEPASVNVISMKGTDSPKVLSGVIVNDPFKFSDKFSFSASMNVAAFMWENGYLSEFESESGRVYIYTNNNPLEKGNRLSGYFIPVNVGSRLQSLSKEKSYLDVVIPIYNLDPKTNEDL
jgi:hypothetical protein